MQVSAKEDSEILSSVTKQKFGVYEYDVRTYAVSDVTVRNHTQTRTPDPSQFEVKMSYDALKAFNDSHPGSLKGNSRILAIVAPIMRSRNCAAVLYKEEHIKLKR